MRLLGRQAECQVLDRLLRDAVAGRSRVVVLRGEAGIGKSALLGYVSDGAQAALIARAVGVESEMELAYNGLHQLCAPMLDRLDRLPSPQRAALGTVFGLSEGPTPDRFLVGLAALTLFADVAEHRPLVCIVDDAQWLDQVSAQILGFVARRVLAERVAIVCAARTRIGEEVLAGLPELVVGELGEHDSLALLLENLQGPLDAAVCRRIVAESHGNPLALLEFPRTWSVAELAGGFGLPEGVGVNGRIEESYVRRLRVLPADTQLLVLAAAAEPLGDPVLLQRVAERLEIDMAAVDAAADAGLLSIAGRVRFAHPLVRSCAYHSAAAHDRHRVHRALADATDREIDPDRRAWHRAQAARGPDEDVAAELERSAGRAQARGGVAAAAAFLRRAVALTPDPARRAERALGAAEASLQAGAFDDAVGLVAIAEAEALNEFQRARADLLRGHLAYASGRCIDACPLLLQAARSLEGSDIEMARETYLIAWFAATILGHRTGEKVMLEICRAVQALPRPQGAPPPLQLLLDGMAALTTDGRVAATPVVQRAAAELTDLSVANVRRWGWAAPVASGAVWDDEGLLAISARNLQIVRDAGAFAELPQHLLSFGIGRMWIGDLAGVANVMAETESLEAATGRYGGYLLPALRALQGNEAEASALIAGVVEQAGAPGRVDEATPAHWAAAVLYNGLARYEEAKAAAQKATWNRFNTSFATWALPELVEAAARGGDVEVARDALERLAETTQPAGTDFALGIEARCRALLAHAGSADALYREAIARLERRQLQPDQARAHLLYGEWLRREGRRVDAREQLSTAYDLFVTIGMEAFAERARRELMATGEKVRKRSTETRDELTPQEEQIARLARDGLSNPEIAGQLYISAKTVEWHLGKVFTKLGITSRRQLRHAAAAKAVSAPQREV
jgi:DNA-binding CsgD family transcriptional regulator